jgi:hypothetical protein
MWSIDLTTIFSFDEDIPILWSPVVVSAPGFLCAKHGQIIIFRFNMAILWDKFTITHAFHDQK